MSEPRGWAALLDAAEAAPDDPVRVSADGVAIRGGYHVTEMRRVRVDAIDCGLGRRGWEEAQLQILDGTGDDAAMTGATLARLLRRSAAALGLAPDLPLTIEAAPGGGGLRRHRIAAMEPGPAGLTVTLDAVRAECRPRAGTEAGGAAGCCAAPACCG